MSISSIFQRNDADTTTIVPSSEGPTIENIQTDTDDVVSNRDISGLLVTPTHSGFRVLITVKIEATQDRSETFDFIGSSNGTAWTMSQASVTNGSTNVVFNIVPSTGQIQYTSTPTAGFISRTFKWVVETL